MSVVARVVLALGTFFAIVGAAGVVYGIARSDPYSMLEGVVFVVLGVAAARRARTHI